MPFNCVTGVYGGEGEGMKHDQEMSADAKTPSIPFGF
jgi:hypothetical protein